MKNIAVILSLIIISGCAQTVNKQYASKITDEPVIQKPEKPKLLPVDFFKLENNYCVDETNAKKIIYNIEAMKLYIEFLEQTVNLANNQNQQKNEDTTNKQNK